MAFPDWATRIIDAGFGFFPPGGTEGFDPFTAPAAGPCARGEASFSEKFRQASIASGVRDYFHPATMVWFVWKGSTIRTRRRWDDLPQQRGSPHVRRTTIPGVTHAGPQGLYASRNAADKIRDIIIDECRPRKL